LKLKLDENLGKAAARQLRARGHDVETVHEEGRQGASDQTLIRRCQREGRALVSLDLGFANPVNFLPSKYAGIAVLRIASQTPSMSLEVAIDTLASGLETDQLEGRLWIVEPRRIRIYQEPR
jgi:predicted nuclease of predicted toxin-antitoxin system